MTTYPYWVALKYRGGNKWVGRFFMSRDNAIKYLNAKTFDRPLHARPTAVRYNIPGN